MTKGNEYYGGYFWLAVISFVVPLFVAVKAFQEIAPTTKPTPVLDASGVDHAVWDYLLKSYVANGLVDYQGIQKDYLFREYLRELGAADPAALNNDDEKLALMCNAYNAFVINGVVSHKINDTVDDFDIDGTGFFDLEEHIFAGKTMSLNDLEHGMIRPLFKEPRIHVALVCAAKSCPAIRGEAYVGARIDQQLEDQSFQFANDKKYVSTNEKNELLLSPILSWYGGDWDEKYPAGGYLAWIRDLVEDPEMKGKLDSAIKGETPVKFVKYDWTLNSQATPGEHSGGTKKSGDFGSGSIPDE